LAPAEITKRLNTNVTPSSLQLVQMPSLESIQLIDRVGPLRSYPDSVSTTYMMLKQLGLATYAPGFGPFCQKVLTSSLANNNGGYQPPHL
jgi:maleate isomerase